MYSRLRRITSMRVFGPLKCGGNESKIAAFTKKKGAGLASGPSVATWKLDQPTISLPANHCAISCAAVSGASEP
ncbi:hypothetical protein M2323_000410 [Rhodoblastus acidophilus]|nr:hypothetical protein [Rhodoblastus acidophilus]MCW2331510.1 hypothetical protein [Rhodoblastus acidophilus]